MSDEGSERPVGHWYLLLAIGPNHWDRTAVGVAVYERGGALLDARFTDPARAVRRGDLPSAFAAPWPPTAPADEQAMARHRSGTGHAMSCLQWEGPLPTLLGPATAQEIIVMITRADGALAPASGD